MDNFNKVFSFILGLVVVIIFLAVFTGKIKLPGRTTPLFANKVFPISSPTPISTLSIKKEEKTTTNTYNTYQTNNYSKTTSIPATGIPTLFLPSIVATALIGRLLSKSGKK